MCAANSASLQLVWLDANIFTDENKALLGQMRKVVDKPDLVNEFVDKGECIRFFTRGIIGSNHCVVVVSGRLGPDLVPSIHARNEISSIYVYCGDRQRAELWAKDYSKVNDASPSS